MTVVLVWYILYKIITGITTISVMLTEASEEMITHQRSWHLFKQISVYVTLKETLIVFQSSMKEKISNLYQVNIPSCSEWKRCYTRLGQ